MLGHLIYGGYDFGEIFYCHAEKPLMPPLAIKELTAEGADGARFSYRTANPVEIQATFFLRDPKQSHERMRAILDEVAENLYPQQQELYLPTFEDRCYIASVAGTSTVQEFVATAKLNVTFRSVSPFMYGRTKTMSLAAGANYVSRGGNVAAPFKATLTATADANFIRIQNGTGSNRPKVMLYKNKKNEDVHWSGGESVVVDMGGRSVTVGGTRWPFSLSSDFWPLDGETVNIHMTGATGSVEWRETWL